MTLHTDSTCGCSRRGFLGTAMTCSAYVAFALAGAGPAVQRAFAGVALGEEIQTEPHARVEKIAEGVWAVVSTPFANGVENPETTTFSNGGIIAGRDGVLAIEGFATATGAAWQSDLALALTGRRPTHVVITHHHFDHSTGLVGYQRGNEGPEIISTMETRNLVIERIASPVENAEGPGQHLNPAGRILTPDRVIADASQPTEIDLGGRVVRLVPRAGHTASDLTIEIDDPRVIWTGDLCFNRLFPYFGDATPSLLAENGRALLTEADTVYVPGHGPVADAAGLRPYLDLLADIEVAARRFHDAGVSPGEAWERYEIPESLGEWTKFRPDVSRFAFEAWERELGG
jgi:glyoxylase-like metal-dependent hydrolase (beta-lactamase superfamily II)